MTLPEAPPLPTELWPEFPTERQLDLLLATERRVLYGGSAGGGKSSGLLMAASQYADHPDYRALVIRKSFSDLVLPGAILDRALSWWRPRGVRYEAARYRFTFPSGAQIQFGYLNEIGDEHRYQGAEFSSLIVDETAQLKPEQVRYLGSRLRLPLASDLPIRMRFASNPGGPAHDWLYHDFVNPETRQPDTRFIPAGLADNPHINAADYIVQLNELDPVLKAQLLHGDWNIRVATGWLEVDKITIAHRPECAAFVRSWDCASTAGAGDYSVGILVGKTTAGTYYIADVCRGQWAPADVEQRIRSCAASDPPGTTVAVEQEPGSAGVALMQHFARNVLPGYPFRRIRPTGPKTSRAAPLAAAIANGLLSCQQADWTQPLLSELASFPDGVYDDQVDALAQGYNVLARPERRENAVVFH